MARGYAASRTALAGEVTVTGNPNLCMSSIDCVVAGIVQPSEPPDEWSVEGNNECC
jgi:hypothetical protein